MKIQVPVIRTVDALVVGGTISACANALRLKRAGYSVFLITPFSYFGEDLCAFLDLQSQKSSDYKELLGFLPDSPCPMEIKQSLDKIMIENEMDWLFQSTPVALMKDDNNRFSGVIFANRSGFYAVSTRCVLDASFRNLIARMTGAETKAFQPGRKNVSIFQVGACGSAEGLTVEKMPLTVTDHSESYPVFKAVMALPFDSASSAEYNKALVKMRRAVFHPDALATSDLCKVDWGDDIISPSPESGILVPETFHLASGILKNPDQIKSPLVSSSNRMTELDVVRKDTPIRNYEDCHTIELDLNSFPICENTDVLVIGAGTAGAPAAIAAARSGAKTLVTETLGHPGGVCTSGMICVYWYGNRIGFTKELDDGCWEMGPIPNYKRDSGQCNPRWKQEWLLEQADNAGAEFRFFSMSIATVLNGNRVTGSLSTDLFGTYILLGKTVIDATGNADVAAAAGSTVMPLVDQEPAVQGAGLAPLKLGANYQNTDYTFVCDCDAIDASRAFVMARNKFAGWFDCTQMLDTRERRRIIGDIVLQPQDFYANRRYSDTITVATSNFDTHGFIIHPMFMLKPTEEQPYTAYVPFRALIPSNLDGILVTGLAVSAHRDCIPLIRMQPDVQNQGYAAGLAAAMSAQMNSCPIRNINLKSLQKSLINIGNLPQSVLTDSDSFAGIAENDTHRELADIFLNPQMAETELLRKLSENPNDLHSAHILAFLGNPAGKTVIEKNIADNNWDKGWNYRGMGQFGFSVSPLDSLIFALTKVGSAPDIILNKLALLNWDTEFSHIRSVCMYFLRHPDSRAAKKLEAILKQSGVTSFAIVTYADAVASNREDCNDTSYRNSQLKEIYLAKALAACEPENKLACSILECYKNSMQTYFSLFAAE